MTPDLSQPAGCDRKRLFFVGDNRRNVNWGRGASIALREILSASFEINGSVGGELLDLSTADAGIVGTLMPGKHYRIFRYMWQRRRRIPFTWYVGLEELFGARDFVDDDPGVSVGRFLSQRHRYSTLARIYEAVSGADVMVVDGDGDIVFSTPPRRQTLFLLAMIELGIRLGKPVFLVNSMISDCPTTGRNQQTLAHAKRLFTHCRAIYLRDPESFEYAQKEMPEAISTLIPDSLFSWLRYYAGPDSKPPANGNFCLPYPEPEQEWGLLDFSQPYICIGGGALSGTQPEKAIESYSRLVDGILQLGYRVYVTENDIPDRFLREVARRKGLGVVPVNAPILLGGAILADARLFISGRYHPSILASLGGTPCIFLGSHAHKMSSLSRVLEYDLDRQFSAFPTQTEIEEVLAIARRYLDQGEDLRERIKRVSKLRSDEAMTLPKVLQQELQKMTN